MSEASEFRKEKEKKLESDQLVAQHDIKHCRKKKD